MSDLCDVLIKEDSSVDFTSFQPPIQIRPFSYDEIPYIAYHP